MDGRKVTILDQKLRQMLEQLSRALHSVIAESEDVHVHLDRIRDEGYSLNLLLDCQPDLEQRGEKDLEPRSLRMLHGSEQPTFRIDSNDLTFLKSVGIDPTRRCKPRKKTTNRVGELPQPTEFD